MLAIQVNEFGGPEVLTPTLLPDPVPQAGEAVVAVSAVDTLWVETAVRRGVMTAYFPIRPPYVPGGGVSGTVATAGEDVDPSWTGRRVAVRTTGGGYATQVVTPAAALVAIPDGVDDQTAAALLHDGPTALVVVDQAAPRTGDLVLITGASGGMGVLAVQLAKAAGALVIAGARGEEKLDLVAALGADTTVDLSADDWADRVLAAFDGRQPDVVLDGVGGPIGTAAFAITADGGRFSAHGTTGGGFAEIGADDAARRSITVRGIADVQLDDETVRTLLERSLAEAAAGRLRPVIGQTFPLDQAVEAHASIEERSVLGKTLLIP